MNIQVFSICTREFVELRIIDLSFLDAAAELPTKIPIYVWALGFFFLAHPVAVSRDSLVSNEIHKSIYQRERERERDDFFFWRCENESIFNIKNSLFALQCHAWQKC